jgi:excisionase family DNA binding protein
VKLFNVKEAAKELAISPWTVRAYIRNGRLRPVRIGRLVRLEQEELENFVAQARVPAVLAETIEKENQ